MHVEELIKKQTNWIKALFVCFAAILAAIIVIASILIPKITRTIDNVEKTMTEVNVLIADADKAIGNINDVDFEHLNQSINDLSVVTNALASLFGKGSN